MRKRVSMTVCATAVAVVIALVLSAVATQAQMQRGRGRGMLRMACNIEGLWAELSFGAKLDDAKLIKARSIFQKAWDERGKVGTEITDPADIPDAFGKLEKIFTDLLDNVKKGTSEEEFKKLSPWIESQNEVLEMIKQRFGGAGGM